MIEKTRGQALFEEHIPESLGQWTLVSKSFQELWEIVAMLVERTEEQDEERMCSYAPNPKATKPPVHQGVFNMFPNALLEIAKASQFGAEKYGWENWGKIPTQEYKDALGRHLLQKGVNEESGLLHLTHVAWNALAVLELTIQENKVDNPENS